MTEQELKEKITEILASCLSANDVRPRVKEVFDAFEKADYVRLADDQTLPSNNWGDTELNRGWHIAQISMLKEDWRRVILE